MKIVLTRESGFNGNLRSLTPTWAILNEVPLTKTVYRPLVDVQADLETSGHYRSFWSVVVSSVRSGDYVETALRASQRGAAIFSVGPATTRALVSHDIVVTGEAESRALDFATLVRRGPVLLLGAASMCDELTHVLQERGVVVAHVACYETLSVEPTSAQRETLANADVVFIGAPSAWAVAKDFVSPSAWVIVPGTTTGEVVRASHEQVFEGWNQATCDMLASLEG